MASYNPAMNKVILGIVALICSRVIFMFIDDPEGPNLLIVFGLAVPIYVVLINLVKIANHNRYN